MSVFNIVINLPLDEIYLDILESIINNTRIKITFSQSFDINISLLLLYSINFYIIGMKSIAIFILLYHSAYNKNTNYIFCPITHYLYIAKTKIDIITFFNQLEHLIPHIIS